MKDYQQTTYGDQAASFYDEMAAALVTADCVSTLAELAGDGPVLELGVGTGRLAVALAERGLSVDGVDCSQAMLDRLRTKDQGNTVTTFLGDFAVLSAPRSYRLVVVAIDTLFMLTSQDEQVSCFQRVARHLVEGGVFVVDVFYPPNARALQGGVVVRKVSTESVVLGASVHDPVGQLVDGQQIVMSAGNVRFAPGRLRYSWPAELDLMARLAGLELRERWGGWGREPFTASSPRHVSVYGLVR